MLLQFLYLHKTSQYVSILSGTNSLFKVLLTPHILMTEKRWQTFTNWAALSSRKNISAEDRKSCRFETTWGWVNDDRTFIFPWNIPLNLKAVPELTEERLVSVLAEDQVVRSNLFHQRSFKISHYGQWKLSWKRQTTAWPSEMVKVARCCRKPNPWKNKTDAWRW